MKKFNVLNKIRIQYERVLLETWMRLALDFYFLVGTFIHYALNSNQIFGTIFNILLQIYILRFLKHSKTLSTKRIIFLTILLLYFTLPILLIPGRYNGYFKIQSLIVTLTYIDLLLYIYKFSKKSKTK